jgi:hypothetical protein
MTLGTVIGGAEGALQPPRAGRGLPNLSRASEQLRGRTCTYAHPSTGTRLTWGLRA